MARGKRKGSAGKEKRHFSKIFGSLLAGVLLILFFWGIWELAARLGGTKEKPRPLAVVIDPGHGGVDGGTVGVDGLVEKHAALAISFGVKRFLEEAGVPVVMTRGEDRTVSIRERWTLANAAPRLAFVSVHLNAGPVGVTGTETLYSFPKALDAQVALRKSVGAQEGAEVSDTRGDMLAMAVQKEVCALAGTRDRGTKNRPELGVTRRAHCPAVLVECGFVSDPEENRQLGDPEFQTRLARGIANGVLLYLREVELDPQFGILVLPPPGG